MNSFDYVIVGAGSAGCVLADRLSARGDATVLLLEAGGEDDSLWLKLPIGYGKSFYDPRVNWMLRTAPEATLGGREAYWPRGKVLGGSSSINAMVFMRGHPQDFDEWAEAGNAGWSWREVLPYFKRLECSDHGPSAWRGGDGPVHVSDVSASVHPLCEVYLQAARQAGFDVNPDLNGEHHEGAGINEITTRNGRRESSASAYLRRARRRANLQVLTHARATRIEFEGTRARGVQYLQGGITQTVRACREVIVCAGAIHSPQLLMCSGVGPAAPLQALGIAMVADLPAVGQHLQDHLCIDHLYRSRVPTLNQTLGSWHGKLWAGLQYALARKGPLALSVNQGGGFVRSHAGLTRPDMQLYFSPLSYLRARPGVRALMAPDPFPGFLLSAQPCRPSSRGQLTLRSANLLEAPLIKPNSLATEHDVQALLQASQLLRRLAATPAFSAVIESELAPGAALQSPEQLIEDIRQRASTVFHPVSTCRMGPHASQAVVNAKLQVHGLQSLRVVDASVFPTLTSGNTHAPTLMLAERGADLILDATP